MESNLVIFLKLCLYVYLNTPQYGNTLFLFTLFSILK